LEAEFEPTMPRESVRRCASTLGYNIVCRQDGPERTERDASGIVRRVRDREARAERDGGGLRLTGTEKAEGP